MDDLENDELKKKLIHIHRNFGHPAGNKLQSLLKNAGISGTRTLKLMDEVSESCKTCKLYKKVPSRPVVGLTRATRFNELVAIHLKNWEN